MITKHLTAIAMLRNDLLLSSSASDIDGKLLSTLLKKLMEARGSAEIVAWETGPKSLKFTDLKIKVAQQLSRFEPEGTTKHPKLNPVAPPGVALLAFDTDDEAIYNHTYSIALQAINAVQQHTAGRCCYNCH
eukprot:2183974-Rhodomonas_salina.1